MPNSGEVSGGRTLGRERRGCGLDDPTRLDQTRHQRFVAADVGMPGENLRIEEIPIVPVADPDANASPGLQKPLCRQDLDGFANGRAVDAELNSEVVLPRQQVVGSVSPAKDPSSDGVHDRAMDLALVTSGGVAHDAKLGRERFAFGRTIGSRRHRCHAVTNPRSCRRRERR